MTLEFDEIVLTQQTIEASKRMLPNLAKLVSINRHLINIKCIKDRISQCVDLAQIFASHKVKTHSEFGKRKIYWLHTASFHPWIQLSL